MLTALLLAGAALAFSVWIYRRRELPLPGLWPLALLRTGALALTLALLVDLRVPAPVAPGGARSALLLDVSLSLAGDGGRPWREALDSVRAGLAAEPALVLFGERPRRAEPSVLDTLRPEDRASRVAGALAAAAEAGAERAVVVSDGRLADPASALAAAERAGLALRLVRVGGEAANAAVERVRVPTTLERGDSLRFELDVRAEGGAADTLVLELLEEGRTVWRERRPVGAGSVRLTVAGALPPPRAEGWVRYTARVVRAGDAFAADDALDALLEVAGRPPAVVFVSVAPDWEPRFLLPVLAQVTGLEARGFVALADGRFVPTGGGSDPAAPVDSSAVRAWTDEAALLVVQGAGEALP
ncbi:MAG: hypothetical protein D6701_03020, partial [Gemmatimonadetes bacterium]